MARIDLSGSIWIVDDSPLEAQVAREVLSPRFRVELFSDGASMLERLANAGTPDLLILDWRLPGMSGIEVCRFVRSSMDQVALPILMLTVHGDKADVVEGLSAGANDYLRKPFDAAELLARATSLYRVRQLNDALRVERARLHEVLSTVPAYVAVTHGRDHTVSFVNPLCRIALGNTDVLGKSLAAFGPEALPPELLELWERVYTTGQQCIAPEIAVSVYLPNGERATAMFRVTLLPQPAQNGLVEGVLGFAVEVTNEVEARRQAHAAHNERQVLLAQAQKASQRAEQANRAKDDFLATVSHELRTPLNAILGWVALLRSGQVTGERLEHALATIDRSGRAQTQLIDDLLDVSRIMSGKLKLALELTDVAQTVAAAVEALRPNAEKKKIAVQCEIEQGSQAMADAVRLKQVVWNLLTNALKFTPAGGNVFVTLKATPSRIHLSVRDDGQGIPPEALQQIFERFKQAESSFTRSHGGLGLGLAIVRHIVELHGGTVSAESEGPGKGATFHVVLPRLADVAAAPVARKSERPSGAFPTNRLSGVRILVVDDDDDGREVAALLLRQHGAEVVTASSARTALDELDRAVPDILVSDLGMPEEDGFSLLRKLRSRSSDAGGGIPALALTAYARAEDRAQCLMAGFNSYVTKPIEPMDLVMAVANLTGASKK